MEPNSSGAPRSREGDGPRAWGKSITL
jgi:hypothetical protein